MRRETWSTFLIILIILAALAAKGILLSVPALQHAPGEFDAARAKARLAFILGDQQPHPADSAADDQVRNRLVVALKNEGLQPLVRDQMACNAFAKWRLLACARVRNVIARIGPANGKALLLNAHYDSVPVGPGASDDGIGVATLLEIGSIMKGLPIRRPILFLFNEGEELGLVGARAFLADPLSRKVDSLLNFEARGVNGPVTMFETNQPNDAAIATYADAVKRKNASSLSIGVARLIPNDTDVTTFKERGWLTLNSAIVGNETRYHSAGDDLSGLDLHSLKDMGDEALGLTVRLASGAPIARGTRIFFDIAQHGFLDLPLPVGLMWLLLLVAVFLFVNLRNRDVLAASGLVVSALILSSALGWLALTTAGMLRAGTYWRAHPELAFTALYATVLLGELALFLNVGSRLSKKRLRAAYWLVFLLIGGLFALVAPVAIIYFLVPPSLLLLGLGLSRWFAPAQAIGAILGLLSLYVTLGELLAALEQLFSPGPLWVTAPVAAVLIAPALIEAVDVARRGHRRAIVRGSLAMTSAAWLLATTSPAYSQDHQQRFTIEHVTLFPARQNLWSILNDGARLPVSYDRLGSWRRSKFEFSEQQRWLAAAPEAPHIQPPSITPIEVSNNGSERIVRLRISANGAERLLILAPASALIRSAGFPGVERPIEDKPSSGKLTIACTGRSCDGAEFMITLGDEDPVDFTVVGSRNGLPASAFPLMKARPRFARPQYLPDETVTISHVRV